MGERGPAKKPRLTILREGNPGKRPVPEALELPPAHLAEPDWSRWFPVTVPENDDERQGVLPSVLVKGTHDAMAREQASDVWRRVYPVLDMAGMVGDVDLEALRDYCITVGRLLIAERDISIRGMNIATEKGEVQNPSIRTATACRNAMKNYARKFGLTPSDRNGLSPSNGGRGGGEGSGPFDI